jgi:hypothetical protein
MLRYKTKKRIGSSVKRHRPHPGMAKMVISADGAMVPLVHGEWAEVKTLVIGEVLPAVLERGEWVVHTEKLSYFSRLTNSEHFEHLTLGEIHRRGVENSRAVAAVTDGAEWLQSFVDYHCPKAVRILDFPHAGQRIGQIAEAIWGQDSAEARQWTSEQLHQLKHQGPTEVLARIRALQEQHLEVGMIQENLGYLEKRQAQMHAPQSLISATRMAAWQRDRRKREQTGRRGSPEGRWHALETRECRPPPGPA